VDSKQLFRHVKALNFKRYTQVERDREYLTFSQKLGWSPTLQPFEAVSISLLSDRVLIRRLEQSAAHYDTVPGSPGADDNASGVAVVLEVVFSVHAPPRTLQLAFSTRLGLRGRHCLCGKQAHLEKLWVIVMDMVGFACYTLLQRYPTGLPIIPSTTGETFWQ